jgi:hypothetical protein
MNVEIDELILLAVGAFLTIWGMAKMNERRKLLKTGIRVQGVVFRLDESWDSEGRTLYHPVIRFVTLEQEWITKKLEIGTRPSLYREGEDVKVIYDPTDNERFIIDNLSGKITGLLIAVAGILIIISLIIYYILHQL